jgi:dTDP-4-dehydrorhamnose reductase
MLKIALTGASGLVGSRIIEILKDRFDFIPVSQDRMDITNKDQVEKNLSNLEFDIFLHLAAYTNVDGAEKEKTAAYVINVKGTENVFKTVKKLGKKFIYVSTDFVFDGQKPPYFEDSQPNPISYYGLTKYEGERIVRDQAMIVRFSYPYRARFDQKKDFVRTIKTFLEQQKSLTMVNDSLMTPTFIDDIAESFGHLFLNFSPKIYHIIGQDSMSPFQAARKIAETFNLDSRLISSISYDEYFKNKAKRPKLADMKSKKNDFFPMKTFSQGLKILSQSSMI